MNRVLTALAVVVAFAAGAVFSASDRTLSSHSAFASEQLTQQGPCDHPGCRVGRDLPKARSSNSTWASDRSTSDANAEEITLDSYHELS
jgi:hypothetical protein